MQLFVTTRNTDLTEGRGEQVIAGFYTELDYAVANALGADVMGTDGTVHEISTDQPFTPNRSITRDAPTRFGHYTDEVGMRWVGIVPNPAPTRADPEDAKRFLRLDQELGNPYRDQVVTSHRAAVERATRRYQELSRERNQHAWVALAPVTRRTGDYSSKGWRPFAVATTRETAEEAVKARRTHLGTTDAPAVIILAYLDAPIDLDVMADAADWVERADEDPVTGLTGKETAYEQLRQEIFGGRTQPYSPRSTR